MKHWKTFILSSFLILFFSACNPPSEETGENLVPSDSFNDFDKTADIYFMNGSTLFGVRDNNLPGNENVLGMEKFMEVSIPSTEPTRATPVIFKTSQSTLFLDYNAYNLTIASGDGSVYRINVPSGEILWKVDLGGSFRQSPKVLYRDNKVYFLVSNSFGTFYCLDADDGSVVWSFENPNTGGFEGVDFSRTDTAVTTTSDGWVYALDTVEGTVKWSYNAGGIIQSNPRFADGNILITRQDGTLILLNVLEGTPLWSRQITGTVLTTPSINPFKTEGIPVDRVSVFVSSLDRTFYDIILEDGGIVDWTIDLDASIYSTAAYHRGDAFVTTRNGTIYAIDVEAGLAIKWQTTLPNNIALNSSPIIVRTSGRCYVNNSSGLYGLNIRTGKIETQFTTGLGGGEGGNINYQSSPFALELPSRDDGEFFPVAPSNL